MNEILIYQHNSLFLHLVNNLINKELKATGKKVVDLTDAEAKAIMEKAIKKSW